MVEVSAKPIMAESSILRSWAVGCGASHYGNERKEFQGNLRVIIFTINSTLSLFVCPIIHGDFTMYDADILHDPCDCVSYLLKT